LSTFEFLIITVGFVSDSRATFLAYWDRPFKSSPKMINTSV